MNVSAIHEEIFMCYVASRGAFEVAPELKFNVIFYGPPESGKSYATGCMFKLSIAGTVENISVQTARADATEVNMNGTTICRDELPAEFFDPNGSAEEKERLTTGLVTTVQCYVDKDDAGRRVRQKTVSRHQSILIGLTNEFISKICAALRSRIFTKAVPVYYERPGKGIMECIGREKDDPPPETVEMRTLFIQQSKTMQMLHCFINTMISVCMMDPPCLKVAFAYFCIYKESLAKNGIVISAREIIKLWR